MRPDSDPPPAGDPRTAAAAALAAARAGDIGEARRLAILALAGGGEHPALLNLRALDHEEHGRFDAALSDLQRAHALAPSDPAILNALGLCLGQLDRRTEALAAFDQVVALAPAFGPGWFNRGHALEHLGQLSEASSAYEKAVGINPGNAQAWGNLAAVAARRGDRQGARRCADRALALRPDLTVASLVLAEVDLAEPAKAEARLGGLLGGALSDYDHAVALSLLGDAFDAQDRAAEAFAAYQAANALFRRQAAPRFEGPGQESLAQVLAWLLPWAERLDGGRWRDVDPAPSEGGEAAHVFLIGFPRSGSTLAEAILANHPRVLTLSERDTLQAGAHDYLSSLPALEALAALPPHALKRHRQDYWARVRRFAGDPAGRIVLDKNPFNTFKLPLIYKLFPSAKIIFCIRDPRDVVLSALRRRFTLNPSTYELLDLDRAAACYAAAMRLADVLRVKQPMTEHRLVYEHLARDVVGGARILMEFIGADWREGLLDIAPRALRGEIASASAAQIAGGVNFGGVGRWRLYQAQLAPILPLLAPWVRAFGYPSG